MRLQRELVPDGSESWTVLNARGEPVPAVEGFLAHLQHVIGGRPVATRPLRVRQSRRLPRGR